MVFDAVVVPGALRGAITQAWILDMPAAHGSERVLPMPTTEIIVNLSDPYRLADDPIVPDETIAPAGDRHTPPVFCTGLRPRVVRFGNPPRLRHVAVRLPCYGPARFGSRPTLGVGPVTGALGAALQELAIPGADPATLAPRILEVFTDHVRDETDEQRCVRDAADSLQSDPTRAIGDVASAAGISHKALIARFRRVTGVTPSRFAQLVMVDAVVRAVPVGGTGRTTDSVPTWTTLVAESPYVDQSHFIRSFRRLVGMSPREYRDALARSRYSDPRFVPGDARSEPAATGGSG